MKKLAALVMALVLCLSLFSYPASAEDFKLGVILLHDEDSTYDLNFIKAVKTAQEKLGLSDSQIIIKRNIPESNDCYEAALDLADEGCTVVFADSFGHDSFMLQAAQECPDVQFCQATGLLAHTSGADNYHNAFASIYEGRYMAGIAAGMELNELKAAGKLKGEKPLMGYVGAFTYAEVISGYTSFYLGAKSVCPDVEMKVQFTGSWYDEKEEKAAAEALLALGCDLISQHADSMGAPTACENAGVPNVSYNGSTVAACPNTFLIASLIDWSVYFEYIYNQFMNGEPIATDFVGTVANGAVKLTEINEAIAAAGTMEALEEARQQFIAGTLHVFDTAKEGFITVGGQPVTSYIADVDGGDYVPETEVVWDGYFHESELRSAPYFDMTIDGIETLNSMF